MTGLLSSSSRHVVERNAIVLPAYSFALALIALLGFMAVAAGVKAMPEYAGGLRKLRQQFRGAGAVPAHVSRLVRGRGLRRHRHRRAGAGRDHVDRLRQSLHPQHLSRNSSRPDCTPADAKPQVAKIVAFVAKLGALFFVLALQSSYAIQLQLLGGIWICQTVPAVLLALFTRGLHPMALADRLGGGHRRRAPGWPGAWASKARSMCCTSSAWRCPAMPRSSALALNLAVGELVLSVWSCCERAAVSRRDRGERLRLNATSPGTSDARMSDGAL